MNSNCKVGDKLYSFFPDLYENFAVCLLNKNTFEGQHLMFFISFQVSEMEETILSALRPSQKIVDRGMTPAGSSRLPVDPSELPPDKLRVELELSPDSHITLYGPLLKAFLSIKVQRSSRLNNVQRINVVKTC